MRWKPPMVVVCLLLAACAGVSARVTVNVSTPANNATVTSPVLVSATAVSNKRSITQWQIYVDGTSVYQAGATNSISTNISMTPGTHQVILRAWAGNGQSGSVTLTETVASAPTAQGSVTPTSLTFGSIVINTASSSQTVTFKNTGTATLNITGVSISPAQFAVSGPASTSIAPGSSAAYGVTFKPTATTAYSGTLSFTTNSASGIAPVTLSGTGVNPTPTPTPSPTPNPTPSATPTPTPSPSPGGNASCLGTTYFVSNSGSDSNNGISTSSPWKTVAQVVGFEPNLRAGDCVLFQRGGVWNEELTISNVHGTQSNPISFGNYGTGNLPVLDGGSTRLYGIVDAANDGESASSYVTVDGFEIRNATRGGIIFTALAQPGITIQNNFVHNNGYGAYPGACSGCFGVDDGNYGYNEGIAFVGSPNAAYGAKILNNTVSIEGGHNSIMIDKDKGNPLIEGNRVGPGCTHGCIDFKRAIGMMVKDNIVNCSVSVTVNGQIYPGCNATSLYTEQDDTSFVETGTYEQNVVYGAGSAYACLGANGATSGLGPISLKYYNNTCYRGNTSSNAFNVGSCFGGDLTIENNIFDGGGINLGSCSSTWDYNDKFGTSGGPSGSHDMNVDPLFVNPGAMDFHLQTGSPVLNSGFSTILGVPYMGACGTSGTCP